MSQRIKLFVDAHAFDTEYQGTQTFIRELYTGLLNTYPDLDIYWGAYYTDRIQQVFGSLVKPANLLPYRKAGGGIGRFLFDIPNYIKKYAFDFAHFQYLAPRQQSNCRYIVTLHDVLFNRFRDDFSLGYRTKRNLLFGRSIKNADIKTTVSSYSQQCIATDYQVPIKQIHVIPNGVSIAVNQYRDKAEAATLVKDKFGVENFILYVSRVESRKNHALLLEKYLKLELYKQNIALVFIGSESAKVERLQRAIQHLTPEQKALFHWFPQVEQNDLSAFYTACRLFVYPSKGEGFGIPPLEAAICKAPVLCSSATAMSSFDFFKPYTFNPLYEDDLEQKLAQMIAKPPSEEFLNRVAQTVASQYQWQRSSELFYNLITSDIQP